MDLEKLFNKYKNYFEGPYYTFEVLFGKGIVDREKKIIEVHSYKELLWRIGNILEEYYDYYNTRADIWIKPVIPLEKIENTDLKFDIKD